MSEKLKAFSVFGNSVSTLFGYSQPPEAVFYESVDGLHRTPEV